MSRVIKLTKGYETIVDDADFPYLSQWKWHYGGDGYAVREQHLGMVDGKKIRKSILMHRELMAAPTDLQVDHINRNKLDNRRTNLRLATRSQNRANIESGKKKYSELPRGITYSPNHRSKRPFMARIAKDGHSYFLGNFFRLEDAVSAYKQKKLELFGEFAPR